MKKIIEIKATKVLPQMYGKVSDIAKMFGMHRSTVCERLDIMREEGCYDDVVIEEGPKTRWINVEKFEAFMKSRHLKYLRT